MTPAFFPFPFPVKTPLGEGYAIYVMPAPMFENDSWCVVLDDGRILHFSTNQLTCVGNGTYDMDKARPQPKVRLSHFLHECLAGEAVGQVMTACGLRLAPYGPYFSILPEGGGADLIQGEVRGVTCTQCTRVVARPGYQPISTTYAAPRR